MMRVRETKTLDTFSPQAVTLERYRASTGQILQTQEYAGGSVMRKRIEDEVSPSFADLRKCGKFLPLNPTRIITQSWSSTTAPLSGYPNGQTWRVRGSVGITTGLYAPRWDQLFAEHLPPRDESASDAVVLAAMANALSERWDVLTFLAELRSSVETFERLARLFNRKTEEVAKLIRKARRSPSDAWKAFREEWLYWRYGIRPIVYDIISIAETMESIVDKRLLLVGRGYQEEEILYQHSSTPGALYGCWDIEVSDVVRGSRQYRGCCFVPVSSGVGHIQLDPLVTLWELTRYSFVVDRFINIGAWVSTLLPSYHGELNNTMNSWKTVYRGTRTVVYRPNSFAHPSTIGATVVESYEQEEYVRLPFMGPPPFPGFDFRVNAPFAADLVALFARGRSRVAGILNRR